MPHLHGLSTTGCLNQKRFPPNILAARRGSSTRVRAIRQAVAPLMCLVFLASFLVGCGTTPTSPTGPILYTNDSPPSISVPSSAWPGAVCGNGRFLTDSSYSGDFASGYSVAADPAPWEWTQADFSGAPYSVAEGSPDELENYGVMSGTIVYEPSSGPEPGVSSVDLPMSHVFEDSSGSFNDFEYFVAPDTPYYSELASGNGASADPKGEYAPAYAAAKAAPFNFTGPGVLGTEVPSGLVPKPYRASVGSRITQWGDWIVDCGHTPYHTEAMHSPTLTATAQSVPASSGTGPGTSVQLLGNPYVVSQICYDNAILKQSYTDDPNCSPNDSYGVSGCTDGGETDHGEGRDLYDHLICELNHDANSTSNVVNAKADVYTVPVDNLHIMTFFVDAPPSPGSGYSLQLQYNLTLRDGVTIDMFRDGKPGELAVIVVMNPNGFVPAPLGPSMDRYLTWSQLEAMDSDLSTSTVSALNDVCTYLGTCGIHVSQYSNVYPSKFDSPIDYTGGASQLLSSLTSASSGLGILYDDSQPFSIIGGIKLQWVTCGTPTSCTRVGPPLPKVLAPPQQQPLEILGIGNRVSQANNCVGGTPPTFTATIVTNGEKGSVTYKWHLSDGTISQPMTTNISQRMSTVSISMTWTPSTPREYWTELVITSPQSAVSNKANFQILLC